MTKEQFDLKYRGERVAVHCDTEEKAKAFLSLAKSFGYKWGDNEDEKFITYWNVYSFRTSYDLENENNDVMQSSSDWYKHNGYTIVEFELDEPKETFKIDDVVYTKTGYKVKLVDTAWLVEFENQSGTFFRRNRDLTPTKPLKKITEKELADMGYVLVK